MLAWFCEVGGTMRALVISAVAVQAVPVEQHAARRLGRAVPLPSRGGTST